MNENNLEGGMKTGFGKLQDAAGDALGDRKMQADGAAKQVEGRAQDALGSAQQALGQVAGQAKETISKASDHAKDAYGRVVDQAQAIRDQIDPFVAERPYAALGIAAAAGLLLGVLFAGRGPKVVYVRPRD